MATPNDEVHREALKEVAGIMAALPPEATPVDMGAAIHRAIRRRTGVSDPYRQEKGKSNRKALALYPRLKEHVDGSPDPLEAAVTVAAIGNVMDFGANPGFDVDRALEEGLARGLQDSAFPDFERRLREVDRLLYIGDNAGEIVFDRLLVEELSARGVEVTFAVRGGPILNDATLEDARDVGMDEVAEVVASGVVAPGTILEEANPGFLELFHGSPLILSKGQGNYEGLSGAPGPLFFLLMIKCPVVARELGAEVGDLVLRPGISPPSITPS
jgi:uncharacterized protein with ATP-grasp and redox domains